MSKIDKDGYRWRDTLLDGARYYYDNRSYIINALKHTSGQDSFVGYVTRNNNEVLAKEVRRKLMTEVCSYSRSPAPFRLLFSRR